MLNRLLRKLDDVLGRSDADVLPLAVYVLYKLFGGLDDIGLEAVQRALDDLVPLAFKLSAECFVLEPLIGGALIDLGTTASLLS